MSAPLDRGSTVPLCAVCFEAGRATEATQQTRDLLCGCDQHIQQLEQHGRSAVRRARKAASNPKTPSAPAASSARGLTAVQAAGGGAEDRDGLTAVQARQLVAALMDVADLIDE